MFTLILIPDTECAGWSHAGTKLSVMGEIIGEKRLACQNSSNVGRLISGTMRTFIEKQGHQARGRNQLEKPGFPLGLSHQPSNA